MNHYGQQINHRPDKAYNEAKIGTQEKQRVDIWLFIDTVADCVCVRTPGQFAGNRKESNDQESIQLPNTFRQKKGKRKVQGETQDWKTQEQNDTM